jgi:hypothetical protein
VAFALTVDTAAPAAHSVTGILNRVGRAANTATPTLSGRAEPGSAITFRVGSDVVGSGRADSNTGLWSITISTLVDGTYDVVATATDAAGNATLSAPYSLLIDTVAPSSPVITGIDDNVAPVTGPVANGAATNDTTPTVSGTAERGATVTLKSGSTTLGTTTADDTGLWSFTHLSLTQGTYSLTATATDAVGNTSAASQPYSLTIDTSLPLLPAITAALDDVLQYIGPVSNGGATNDTSPSFTGTAEAGSFVTLRDGVTEVGSAVADAQGAWSIVTKTLGEGTRALTATSTDLAGNISVASAPYRVIIDTAAPTAPVITTIESDVPPTMGVIASGSRTNDSQLRVSGTTEPNGRVTFWIDYGTPNAVSVVTTANPQGRWAVTTPTLSDGQHAFSALVRDAASNRSGLSAASSVTVDTVAPRVVSIASLLASGTYGIGQSVDIQVRFGEDVQVGGTPTLTMNTSPARTATFIGSSGNTVTFRYVTAVGDASGKLDYASPWALSANGGWIRDVAGGDANLSLPAPGTQDSLSGSKTIAVDAAIKATAGNLTTSPGTSPLVTRSKTSIPITFNTPVTGVSLASIRLFYEGRSVSLAGAAITGSGTSYTLTLPATTTSLKGTYRLRIGGPGAGISGGGVEMSTPSNLYWKRG